MNPSKQQVCNVSRLENGPFISAQTHCKPMTHVHDNA